MAPSSRKKPKLGLPGSIGFLVAAALCFALAVVAAIVSFRRVHALQGKDMMHLTEHEVRGPPKDIVYHQFQDATGHFAEKMTVLAMPPPPPPPPPPPVPTAETVRASDGKLTIFLPPATERNPDEVKREGARLSKSAYEFSLQEIPEMQFDPPGGPMKRIDIPSRGGVKSVHKYHVVVTGDCGLYGRWQTLVNYYWYTRMKADFPDSPMGGYTRLLHCTQPDDIVHLVPTLLVEPLPRGIDRGYGPMNRPWALSQWLSRMHIPEQYIFMTEPDHIFVAPPPLAATADSPAAFPFWYVDCSAPQWQAHCLDHRFNPRRIPPASIAPIGNSPTLIHKRMLMEMLPRWDRTVRAIHADVEADKALGWAQEMFAFAIALANNPDGPPHVSLHPEFMAQPPFDTSLRFDKCTEKHKWICSRHQSERMVNRSIIHYTYGQDFDEQGQHTYGKVGPWHWDKRDYGAGYPRLPLKRPPLGTPETTVQIIERVERAGMSLEFWGWWKANMVPETPVAVPEPVVSAGLVQTPATVAP